VGEEKKSTRKQKDRSKGSKFCGETGRDTHIRITSTLQTAKYFGEGGEIKQNPSQWGKRLGRKKKTVRVVNIMA